MVRYKGSAVVRRIQAPVPGTPGEPGKAGATVAINLSKQVFNYNPAGVLIDTNVVYLTSTVFNVTGTVLYEWQKNGVKIAEQTGSALPITAPAAYEDMPVIYQLLISSSTAPNVILAKDQVTIFGIKEGVTGRDGYTIIVTNESHSVPASSSGAVTSFEGSGTDILVYKGVTQLAIGYGADQFAVTAVTATTGITAGASTSEGNNKIWRIAKLQAMSIDIGELLLTIQIKDTAGAAMTFTKKQSLTKTKAGAQGNPGGVGGMGPIGPSLIPKGVYDINGIYAGNSRVINIVKYAVDGKWYRAKATAGTFSGQLPTNTAFWEVADAQSDFLSTDLLLANSVYIRNLITEQLKTALIGARIEINAGNKQEIAIIDEDEELKVWMKPTPISSLALIKAGAQTNYHTTTADTTSKSTYWATPNFGPIEYRQESLAFEVTLDGTLEINIVGISLSAGKSPGTYADAMASVEVYLEKNPGDGWGFVASVGSCNESEASKTISKTIKGLSKGVYRLVASHYHQSWTNWTPDMPAISDYCSAVSDWSYVSGSSFAITVNKVLAQTEIGIDGFASIWAKNKFLHFSQDGLFIQMGDNVTFEVTETAVKINGVTHT